MALADAGCFDPAWPHVTAMLVGSPALYAWAADTTILTIAGFDRTHDPVTLAAIEGLYAVNSAIEVDLFGQCNLETASGRLISGAGGAPDFARAARLSRDGLSIVALPSTFGGGRGSRICVHLGHNAVATIARTDVDMVVTEHGVADFRGRSVEERAAALIEVAAPAFRDPLRRAWLKASKTF